MGPLPGDLPLAFGGASAGAGDALGPPGHVHLFNLSTSAIAAATATAAARRPETGLAGLDSLVKRSMTGSTDLDDLTIEQLKEYTKRLEQQVVLVSIKSGTKIQAGAVDATNRILYTDDTLATFNSLATQVAFGIVNTHAQFTPSLAYHESL